MADFEIEQVLGNDSDHRPARLQNGVGDDTHQTDIPAAVHQAPSLCSEKAAQLGRRAAVRSVGAGTGTAEHTDALMHFAISPKERCGAMADLIRFRPTPDRARHSLSHRSTNHGRCSER